MSEQQTWRPIDAGDETLRDALNEANIPALMTALVHLTGNADIIRGDIRPMENAFTDLQGAGIPPEQQQEIRDLAFDVIREFRDNGSQLPGIPDEATVQEMMNFISGHELEDNYVDFLQSELSLQGESAFSQPALELVEASQRENFSVLVIGAGMSGILAAIKLKEAGFAYTVVEKNPEVGGTWFENTYPGCRVDSPNHAYSYSFAPKDWPQYFSEQPVLLNYFRQVAEDNGIMDSIRFNTEVKRARFNEDTALWEVTIETPDGCEVLVVNAVIAAVGQLNRPKIPDITGLSTFAGPVFHSACWEHDHNLTGKKIVVVGTGASAFQFVPHIASDAAEVNVFQRTPPWIFPRAEYQAYIPEGKHWLLKNLPYYAHWYRFFVFWHTSEGMMKAAKRDPAWNDSRAVSEENDIIRQLLQANAKSIVGEDPELFAKVIPDYPPAAKRLLIDNGAWFNALKRDNVNIITDPVKRVTEHGVETESGQTVEADVLIFGTGFHTTKFLWPMEIVGRGGVDLRSHWEDDPRAYCGVTVPMYPNFFIMYGPNTNIVVNGSIIFFSECEMRYILGCIAVLLAGQHKTMEPRQAVHDAYNERIDAANLTMAWGSENVNSWYKNASGRVTQNWPYTLWEFWEQSKSADPNDYEFT